MRYYARNILALISLFVGASFNLGATADCSWDYLTLSQEWLPNFCSSHDCDIKPIVTTWTIHGLWPDSNAPPVPQFCSNATFNEDEIKGIEDQLDTFWPNVFANTPHADLWKHEWTKHGTCAQCLLSLSDELMYFSKTLAMNGRFNLTSALSKANINPSSSMTYKLEDIVNAVNGISQSHAAFMCYFHKKDSVQYITEVHICLDKTLQPIDCPLHSRPSVKKTGAAQNEPCNPDREVVYLPFQY